MAEKVPALQRVQRVALGAPGCVLYVFGGHGSHWIPLAKVPAGHILQPAAFMTQPSLQVHEGEALRVPLRHMDAGTGPSGHTG